MAEFFLSSLIFMAPLAHPQQSAGPGPAAQPGCIREPCPHVEWSEPPPLPPSKCSFLPRTVESFVGISLKHCLERQESQWSVRVLGIKGDPYSPSQALRSWDNWEREA